MSTDSLATNNVEINTKNITFIGLGAFSELLKQKKEPKLIKKIGFGQENSSQKIENGEITADDLEKYGLTVYVLNENDSNINITLNEVKKLIQKGDIKYIFIKNDEEENSIIKSLVNSNGVTIQKWHTLSNISEIEATENQDYFSIMNDNLELLKNELYN